MPLQPALNPGRSPFTHRPFSDFPVETSATRHWLDLLVLVAYVTDDRCFSLRDVHRKLRAFLQAQSTEQKRPIRCPSYNTILHHLPNALDCLLVLSFGRKVKLFDKEFGRISGLSDDGRIAVSLALDFLELELNCHEL